jgi:hypothetical protein
VPKIEHCKVNIRIMETICGVIAVEMLLRAVVSSGEIVTQPQLFAA